MNFSDNTYNEIVAIMHKEGASMLRDIADHIEKWQHSTQEIVTLLREIADEKEAQSVVVKLRNEL